MTLSVIGAGVGRTGTLTLKFALERLGVGPCYHMKEVIEHHLDAHVPAWDRAANGKPVDWDRLFESYRSAVDFPAAAFCAELAEHYPAAKVILTVRDPESWFRSFRDTIYHPLAEPKPAHLAAWGTMIRDAIFLRVFEGNVEDKAHVIACFTRHNEEIKRAFPPTRLLVYEVSEGWGPLCQFLGVPVPDEPFPKVNTTAEWCERIGSRLRA